jgi:hypothetical protein
MKGISHFVSGVAAATFLPQLVHMSAQGSFVLLLAGLGGIMPDTLDFKLARYLKKPDVSVDPDPNALDPQAIAEQIAQALDRAYESEVPIQAQFHTIKLGADLWRQYRVSFDGEKREVRVRIGPLVTTSQVPYPDSDPNLPVGRAPISAPTRYAYDAETVIDAFDGPTFLFRRHGETIEIHFLPWHRRWSHSLTLAALLGGITALALGPLAGLAYALGSVTHILEDQLGHMGSNLAFPFTKRRLEGLKLFHSGDALPNLFTVWLGVVLILFNLDRFSPSPVLDPWSYFLIGLIVPWAAIWGLSWWSRHGVRQKMSVGDIQTAEVQAEAEEVTS